MIPLGIRNNNPLNIRRGKTPWKGEIPHSPSPTGATGGFRAATECGCSPTKGSKSPLATGFGRGEAAFCKFESLEWGIRAAFCLLRTYSRKYHLNCIADIITRWAPPSENDTSRYICNVCRWTGFGGMQRLTESDWPALVRAMARQETGVELSNSLIEKAFEMFKEIQN